VVGHESVDPKPQEKSVLVYRNNLIEDHKEGGTIDGTQGTLSVAEKWFHITGAGIMKKVKK